MAILLWKSCFLQFIVITIFCVSEITSNTNALNFPLPTTIIPTKYNLHISSDIHENDLTFNGSVTIDLIIREQTKEIILNAKQLLLSNITLTNLDSGLRLESPELQHKLDEVKDHLVIHWPSFPLKLKVGQQYRLGIEFVGNIQETEIFGFFKTSYEDAENNSIPIATTQFEPTSARLVFPCFDEPAFKAKFIISITHGSNYSAVSNMPVESQEVSINSNGVRKTTTTFQESVKMSTYLVAFALTNFDKISITMNEIEHRVFFEPNSKVNYSLALENAVKTVTTLETNLGIKYPLPKLDHIPIETSYGRAMENWGLMTFIKSNILSDQEEYNNQKLIDLIIVQNHEIAHQWFGNLVTPKSWSYVWLKEGLSTYFSYFAADLVYPTENVFETFITKEVWFLDVGEISNPLTKVVKEGVDIKSSFDITAYKFGGAFIRMFHHAIGQKTFLKGISKYLLLNQYSVADEDDLFGAIQAAVDEDHNSIFQESQSVANVMRTWTQNTGIPTVTVIRNYDTGTITIRQKSNKNVEEKWWIPLNFATATNPDFERTTVDYIMPPLSEVIIDLEEFDINLSNSDWLIVNKQQTGIFNVVYDDINIKLIAEALKTNHNTVPVFNRALIFRDLSATFDKELDAVEPVLELLQYLKHEEESLPWFNAVDLMLKLISRLKGSKPSEKFKKFIYDMSVGVFQRKYENSPSNLTATDWEMKGNMVELYSLIDTKSCQNYTTDYTNDEFIKEIHSTQWPCAKALCQAIKNISVEEFDGIYQTMITSEYKSMGFYHFKKALNCIESSEIFIYLMVTTMADARDRLRERKLSIYADLLTSSTFMQSWLVGFKQLDEQKRQSFSTKIDEENNLEILNKEKFLKKYENNIYAWLERYENGKELSV